jgi:hypothetical protein
VEGAALRSGFAGRKTVRIYAPFESPRLHYVLRFLMEEQLGLTYSLTQNPDAECDVFYGPHSHPTVLSFVPDGSLDTRNKIPFQEGTDWTKEALPADLFAAVFFLLSRSEEYASFSPDRHGRFPAAQSLLQKRGLLQTPLIDYWVGLLRKGLNAQAGWNLQPQKFHFQPTYDIDIAYAYLHKGRRRTVGGLLRDLKSGKGSELFGRLGVLAGKAQDPFDAFDWLRGQHKAGFAKPLYFMLAAQQPGPFDKNIAPSHPAMAALATDFAMQGTVGIHPSYTTSEQPEKTALEKQWLEGVLGTPVTQSRQHYIRLRFPDTYRQLMATGITDDWSMGFPDAVGFRAGTSQSFYWYDLEREEATRLRVHPFAFMDTTARDYLGWSAVEAGVALEKLASELKPLGGRLTTIFHNFSLGSAGDWKGWRELYEDFLESTKRVGI